MSTQGVNRNGASRSTQLFTDYLKENFPEGHVFHTFPEKLVREVIGHVEGAIKPELAQLKIANKTLEKKVAKLKGLLEGAQINTTQLFFELKTAQSTNETLRSANNQLGLQNERFAQNIREARSLYIENQGLKFTLNNAKTIIGTLKSDVENLEDILHKESRNKMSGVYKDRLETTSAKLNKTAQELVALKQSAAQQIAKGIKKHEARFKGAINRVTQDRDEKASKLKITEIKLAQAEQKIKAQEKRIEELEKTE